MDHDGYSIWAIGTDVGSSPGAFSARGMWDSVVAGGAAPPILGRQGQRGAQPASVITLRLRLAMTRVAPRARAHVRITAIAGSTAVCGTALAPR